MEEKQNQELIEELTKIICSNEHIITLTNIFNGKYRPTRLVGGAVIDILENRVPKDFDLIDANTEDLLSAGFIFKYCTKTADTYEKNGIIVQILKTSISDFDYKISQATFVLEKKTLTIDLHSFLTKELIPVSFNQKNSLNSLRRLPHWRKKGYEINEHTYQSLLNCSFGVSHQIQINS